MEYLYIGIQKYYWKWITTTKEWRGLWMKDTYKRIHGKSLVTIWPSQKSLSVICSCTFMLFWLTRISLSVETSCSVLQYFPFLHGVIFTQAIDENTDINYVIVAEGCGGLVRSRDFVSLRRKGIKDGCYICSGAATTHPNVPDHKKYIRYVHDILRTLLPFYH